MDMVIASISAPLAKMICTEHIEIVVGVDGTYYLQTQLITADFLFHNFISVYNLQAYRKVNVSLCSLTVWSFLM